MPKLGYPDNGNGRFGKKLPYADWYKMQNGQRCQINFLEHITFVVVSLFISGLYYPEWALWLAVAIFSGRLMFTIGYTSCGPKARIPGALIMDLGILMAIGLMIAACVKLGQAPEVTTP